MNQKSNVIRQFKDEYEKFSNFYPCTVYFEGRHYPTVEHAYVASKTKDEMFRIKISKLSAKQAGLAKRLGRKVKIRKDWELVKFSIMKRLLMQKFSQHEFKKLLLSTGNKFIIEGNYWHDNIWGDCYCEKCKNITGRNMLGKMLMEIRSLLL